MFNSNPLSLMNGSYHLRYTPPTCTLEIIAKQSPLSRWTNRPVLKKLQFELSLDDPRVPEDKQVAIRGNRSQLDILYYAVSQYVQNLLQQSPVQLNTALLSPSGAIAPTMESSIYSSSSALPNSQSPPPPPSKSGAIYLQPRGLVSHRLFLGSLATPESGESIDLGALQLFDLATALDEYAAEVMTLPPLEKERSRNWQQPLLWAGAGAAATLLAVGATTTFIRMRSPSEVATMSPAMEESAAVSETSSSLPLPPEGPPPPLTQPRVEAEASPAPTPLEEEELDTVPVEEEERLLPPPPVNPTPIPIPTEPSEGDRSSQSIFVPGDIITGTNPEAAPVEPEVAPSAPPLEPFADSVPPPLPPSIAAESEGFVLEDEGLGSPLPTLPDTGAASSRGSLPNSPTRQGTRDDNPFAFADEAPEPSTAFDVVPQIAEVRDYFQERWEPQPGLTRDLEYTLILNEDGSLQEAIPLGHAADNYIDRTGVPLEGEAMVSPFAPGQTPQLRVVLEADGGVKTFLESLE
ncbi:MAG: DUF4335 domain-containing protein [Cyanobacteriota bacterium]|nr:DUF4335 domain-containing protein [Cyanobacteriota bacterium]